MPGSQPPPDLQAVKAALAAAGNPWVSGTTSMTQLSQDDQLIRLGVPPDPNLPDHDDTVAAAAKSAASGVAAVDAAASFDLRNVGGANYDTPVEDQGGCGSCVAFGTVATIETVFRFTHKTQMPIDLSEAQMFYCWGRSAGATCQTGWLPDSALPFARDKGLTFADYFPYTAGDQDCSKLNADWPNHLAKVTSFEVISGNVAKMKSSIATYGSITACFNVYDDFFSYRSGVYKHVTGNLAGGHCVVLIGYDDGAGCWIARNSWGTGWGDSGYFRIAYGECGIESRDTCAVYGVNVRTWLPAQKVSALWSNQADANIWVAGAQRGWLKLDSNSAVTEGAMLAELAAAKGLGRQVSLFEDSGSVKQIYA